MRREHSVRGRGGALLNRLDVADNQLSALRVTIETQRSATEDLEMIGVSYNTQIGTTGVALQGELSYHMDAPTQVDDLEVLFAALAPLESTIGAGALAAFGQLGGFGTSELVPGIEFQDKYQFQTTATKVFGYIPWLGAGCLPSR